MNEPKNEILSPVQMQEMAMQKQGSRLYSKDTDGAQKVQDIVTRLSIDLANMPKKKADLHNADMITDIAISYTDACAKAGVLPSRQGLCRSLGYSRQGIDYYMSHNETEESAEILRIIFDAYADALTQSALTNSTNMVLTIFLLKSLFKYRDTVAIETELKHDPFVSSPRSRVSEILAKYSKEELDMMLPD